MAHTSDTVGQLLVGEGVTVHGTIRVTGRASVHGVVEGDVQADELIVGPRGQVTGQVSARRIEVSGQTHDTLVASERLVVRSTGVVRGTVRYGELETERGGVIVGMVASGTGTE